MNRMTMQLLGGLGALTLLGATVGSTLNSAAQSPRPAFTTPDEPDTDRRSIRIGTFEPQTAFQRYPAAEELNQRMQGLQQEMQQAQQEGDQQRMMQIQQRMQQMQNEVVEAFYADLDRAMPEVAEDAGVQVIAVQVVYTDPALDEAEDVTDTVIEHLNGEDAEDPDEPQAPGGSPTPW